MRDAIETVTVPEAPDYLARIVQDEDAESPREDDHPSVMVCWHRRYRLGDPSALAEFSTPEDFEEWWSAKHAKRKTSFRLPLRLLDHSGLSMSVGSGAHAMDPGGWDSGQIGWIYSTRETRKDCGTPDRLAVEVMEGEVEEYNSYLTGDVYGIVVKRRIPKCGACNRPAGEEWETVESCWGFIGFDYAKKEAPGMLRDAIPDGTVTA